MGYNSHTLRASRKHRRLSHEGHRNAPLDAFNWSWWTPFRRGNNLSPKPLLTSCHEDSDSRIRQTSPLLKLQKRVCRHDWAALRVTVPEKLRHTNRHRRSTYVVRTARMFRCLLWTRIFTLWTLSRRKREKALLQSLTHRTKPLNRSDIQRVIPSWQKSPHSVRVN